MVHVRYFAAARAAAGTPAEEHRAGSVAELLEQLVARHGEPLARVLSRSSLLVDGLTCHDRTAPLPAGVTVDVLPPFAGG